MRKTAILALATGILWSASCQKTEVLPADGPAASLSANAEVCDIISFNQVAPGTLLARVTSDGGIPVGVSSKNPHYSQPLEAAVFQSSPTLSSREDDDLGSPSVRLGGTGVGTPNPGFENTQALGNLLVLHNFRDYPTLVSPTMVREPNDDDFNETETPGTVSFDFTQSGPVTATSLTVIDVEYAYNNEREYGFVKLFDRQGGTLKGTFNFRDAGPNGVEVVSLGNTAGVGYMEVTLGGSIGIDNLRFCRTTTPPPPPAPGNMCTYTQGYWKNHASAWPVQSLTLGGISYSKAQLLTIFSTPVRGNGLISLAHQLIAAKLNVARGSNPATIASTIRDADRLLVGKNLLASPQPSLPTSQTSALTSLLDAYNNGKLGPAHCN